MIFLVTTEETSGKYRVSAKIYKYENLPSGIQGLLVEEKDIPQAENRVGYDYQLYINPTTKEMWYEHTEREMTAEEKIEKLESQNSQLMLALAELANAAEQDKIETQLAIAELASTLTGGVA